MTNEHNSLKTLFQNTGIVKSINRGTINGLVAYANYDNDTKKYKYIIGSFKNTINPDKSIIIMNFGDLFQNHYTSEVCSSLNDLIFDFKIASNNLSLYSDTYFTDVRFMIYWQVVEFY